MTLCLGYYNDKRAQEYKDRSLHYLIAKSFAVKLPKIQDFWPIHGEPKPKQIRFTKAQSQKLKDFNDLIMNYGWRKKENG